MSTATTARNKALLAALVVVGLVDLAFINLYAAPRYVAEAEQASAADGPTPSPAEAPPDGVAAAEPVKPSATAGEPPASAVAVADGQEESPSETAASASGAGGAGAAAAETAEPVAAAPPQAPSPAVGSEPPAIPDLTFGSGSAALQQRSQQLLFQAARYMRAKPDQRVLLRGHADERGSAAINQVLSEQRARAAAAYLIGLGVSKEKVQISGVGERMPADRGSSPQSLARNRRVVVIWQ